MKINWEEIEQINREIEILKELAKALGIEDDEQ